MNQRLQDLFIFMGDQFRGLLDRYWHDRAARLTDRAPNPTATNSGSRSMSTGDQQAAIVATTAGSLVVLLSIGMVALLGWYRSAIRRRLQALQQSTFFGNKHSPVDPFRMIRTRPSIKNSGDDDDIEKSNHPPLPFLSLNRDFVENVNKTQSEHSHQEGRQRVWKLMSLGEYLSTLRPYLAPNYLHHYAKNDSSFSAWINTELQASLAMVLLQSLGPRWGAALLPGIGANMVQTTVQKLTTTLASWVVRAVTHPTSTTTTAGKSSPSRNNSQPQGDRGGTTLTLAALSYAAEVRYQRHRNGSGILDQQDENNNKADDSISVERTTNSSSPVTTSPLERLQFGEVGYEISFGGTFHCNDTVMEFVPNPFIVSEHWDQAIQNMEQQIGAAAATGGGDSYDPHSRELPAPIPIDERFLPDLHTGWGSAECTHTQRQILENRLLAVLLNRLASNYCHYCNDPVTTSSSSTTTPIPTANATSAALFEVLWSRSCQAADSGTTSAATAVMGGTITKPGDLVRALVKAGHSVEARICTRYTTFGLGLCVKENAESHDDDGNKALWTNIPLALFLLNGFADADGNDAFVALPHSGLSLEVRGPLLSRVNVQHYMAYEGLCGWHSNHGPNVPWLHSIDCGPIYRTVESVVECARVAALEAGIVNSVAVEFRLPQGGYGLTGVCNDSAARIEYALSGQTHVYPLSFHGKFAMHNLRMACDWRDGLLRARNRSDDDHNAIDEDDVQSLNRLIRAIVSLPCDLTSTPAQACDQFRRQWHCQPPPERSVFALTEHSRNIMQFIQCDLQRAGTE